MSIIAHCLGEVGEEFFFTGENNLDRFLGRYKASRMAMYIKA